MQFQNCETKKLIKCGLKMIIEIENKTTHYTHICPSAENFKLTYRIVSNCGPGAKTNFFEEEP